MPSCKPCDQILRMISAEPLHPTLPCTLQHAASTSLVQQGVASCSGRRIHMWLTVLLPCLQLRGQLSTARSSWRAQSTTQMVPRSSASAPARARPRPAAARRHHVRSLHTFCCSCVLAFAGDAAAAAPALPPLALARLHHTRCCSDSDAISSERILAVPLPLRSPAAPGSRALQHTACLHCFLVAVAC